LFNTIERYMFTSTTFVKTNMIQQIHYLLLIYTASLPGWRMRYSIWWLLWELTFWNFICL